MGVTPLQSAAMMSLHAHGPISQAELGRLVGVEATNVRVLVANLEGMAFITIGKHATDARQNVLTLSDAGEATVQQLAAISAEASAAVLAAFAPAERETLLALLGRLALDR